jgi:hypothetical protein
MNAAMATLQAAEDSQADAMAAGSAAEFETARMIIIVALVIGLVAVGIAVTRLIKRRWPSTEPATVCGSPSRRRPPVRTAWARAPGSSPG